MSKRILAALIAAVALNSAVFGTADTFRVVRSGKLVQTASPVVTDITVEGTLTSSTVAGTGDLTITKATPVIEAKASTDTPATIKIDAGASSDSALKFEDNNTGRWAIGNDSSDSDSFVLSSGTTLGSNNALKATTSGVTVPGSLGVTGLITATGGLTAQSIVSLKTVTVLADDTSPDVSGGNIFVTSANTGSTAITTFDNASTGQVIYLVGGSDSNSSTVADSGNFSLNGAFTASTNDVLVLLCVGTNTFIEIGRSDN